MSNPNSVSPFAALSRQEQQEKWLAWQSQRLNVRDAQQAPIDVISAKKEALPPLKLPAAESQEAPEVKQEPEAPATRQPAAPAVFAPQPPRHAQYDAVLNRINAARKKAVHWQPISGQE